MKYLVEIDASSKAGTEAINYLRKVKGSAINIRKSTRNSFRLLTDGELALPMGKKPTKVQLREYLDRDPGKTVDIETLRKRALKKVNQKSK